MFVNETPVNPVIYALMDYPGGRWSFEDIPNVNIRKFVDCGIRLFQVELFFEHFWHEDRTISMDVARRQLKGVIDLCPCGGIFIRLHVNAPRWWAARHPEEWTEYANGSLQKTE